MNEVSKQLSEHTSKLDWREIAITTAIGMAGCLVAVAVTQMLIIPAFNKMKEKKAAAKEKGIAK